MRGISMENQILIKRLRLQKKILTFGWLVDKSHEWNLKRNEIYFDIYYEEGKYHISLPIDDDMIMGALKQSPFVEEEVNYDSIDDLMSEYKFEVENLIVYNNLDSIIDQLEKQMD